MKRKLHINGMEVSYNIGRDIINFIYNGKRYNVKKTEVRGEEPAYPSGDAEMVLNGCGCEYNCYSSWDLSPEDQKIVADYRAWRELSPQVIKNYIVRKVLTNQLERV